MDCKLEARLAAADLLEACNLELAVRALGTYLGDLGVAFLEKN